MSDKYAKCNECFYHHKEHDVFPCNRCSKYSYFLHKDVYTESQPNQAWNRVIEGLNGLSEDDWPVFLTKKDYDVVNKPRHYMLFDEDDVISFEGKGIEVRDVLEKLVAKIKIYPGDLFVSDYVQLMQYLMRFMDKNGAEDLKKARWYLDKLIEAYDA